MFFFNEESKLEDNIPPSDKSASPPPKIGDKIKLKIDAHPFKAGDICEIGFTNILGYRIDKSIGGSIIAFQSTFLCIEDFDRICDILSIQKYKDGLNIIDGNKYYYKNDELHREDGPAIECTGGHKSWYIEGKLHREDGPAV